MKQLSLFNSLKPNGKRVPVNLMVELMDKISTNDGEPLFILTLTTAAIDLNGNPIDTIFVDSVTQDQIEIEIQKALAIIGAQIDWGTLEADNYAPILDSYYPVKNQINVPIDSNLSFSIRDPFPTSFLNLSTLKLRVNGIEVTPQSVGLQKGTLKGVWIPTRIK